MKKTASYNIRFDHFENKIYLPAAFVKKSEVYGSYEFKEFIKMKKENPD